MRKQIMLAFTVAMLITGASAQAMSAPTYDDGLIVKNPKSTPKTSSVVLVPVTSPQTVAAVHDYVMAWQHANERIALAKAKVANKEELTKADKKWLHSMDKHNYADLFRTHSLGRVHGIETALNWNAENRNKKEYNYFEMPKYSEQQGFTNSYGYNVLRSMVDSINEVVQHQKAVGGPVTVDDAMALEDAILDVMARDQEYVANEELRHYMNEVVWYGAKETVDNKSSDEPSQEEEHVVDLRKAINEPDVETYRPIDAPHRVDLRSAINR